jgi:glycosylphosphatidylinositol transamidase (GPIT) subunit GPI8
MILFQLTVCPKRVCISTVGVRKDLFPRDPQKVLITDFFGSLRPVELTLSGLNVTAISRTQNQSRRWDFCRNTIVICSMLLWNLDKCQETAAVCSDLFLFSVQILQEPRNLETKEKM